MQLRGISYQVNMLLSGVNNIEIYSKWFCATELYAIKRNMLITGMRLSGVDCINEVCLQCYFQQQIQKFSEKKPSTG